MFKSINQSITYLLGITRLWLWFYDLSGYSGSIHRIGCRIRARFCNRTAMNVHVIKLVRRIMCGTPTYLPHIVHEIE